MKLVKAQIRRYRSIEDAGAFSVELLLGFDGVVLGQSDAPAALPRSLGRIGLGLRYGGR